MPVFRSADAAMYETHGSRFSSYVAPARGSISCVPGACRFRPTWKASPTVRTAKKFS